MKRTLTTFLFTNFLAVLSLAPGVFAQNKLTTTVGFEGAAYTTLFDAIRAEANNLEAGDSLIVDILDEILYEQASKNLNWGKPLHILIKGAGADKTIIQHPTMEETPPIDGSAGGRIWTINNTAVENSSVTFEGVTFRYWGTASGGNASGSVFNLNNFFYTLRLKNVVFENCLGQSLVNAGRKSDLEFDNVLFINNVSTFRTDGAAKLEGFISMKDGGELVVKNTTFYSNLLNNPKGEEDSNVRFGGGLLNYTFRDDETDYNTNVLLENVIAVNNMYDSEAYDSIQPMIAFHPRLASFVNVTLNNVVIIGNRRPGMEGDTDVLVSNSDRIAFSGTSTGNLLNKAVQMFSTTIDEVTTHSFEELFIPGTEVSADFNYTHVDINFTMDGDLPKLFTDEYGVGYLEFNPGGNVSVNIPDSDPLKIYVFDRVLKVEGVKPGDNLEVYSITGALFARRTASSETFELNIPKGIYVVRAGMHTRKVLVF